MFGYQTFSVADATEPKHTNKTNRNITSGTTKETNEFKITLCFETWWLHPNHTATGHVSKYQHWYTSWSVLPPAATKCPGAQQTMQATISYGPCHGYQGETSQPHATQALPHETRVNLMVGTEKYVCSVNTIHSSIHKYHCICML